MSVLWQRKFVPIGSRSIRTDETLALTSGTTEQEMHSAPSAKQPLGTMRSRARDYRVVIKFERVVATTISARLKDDGNRPVIYPAHSDPQSRARAPATPGHFPPAFHAVSLPFLGRLPSRARFPRTSCLFTCSCGPESLWVIHREQSRRDVSALLVFRLCF